jgi:hypothetical protein
MGTSLQIADPFLFNDWFFNSWKRLSINSYDLRIILSIASKLILLFVNLRTSEVILFSNFIFFYWHFVEILWTFIFLVFYKLFLSFPFIGFSFSKMPFWTCFFLRSNGMHLFPLRAFHTSVSFFMSTIGFLGSRMDHFSFFFKFLSLACH